MDKTGRNGLRVGDIFQSDWDKRYQSMVDKHFDLLKLYPVETDFDFDYEQQLFLEKLETIRKCNIVDSTAFIHKALNENQKYWQKGAKVHC